MTRCSNCHQESEIQKLVTYLMKNHQGQLDDSKTPVDNAIDILKGGRDE